MSSHPTRPYQEPREVLKTHVASMASGTGSQLKETAFSYRVSGGPPGKRLTSTLRITGHGAATYEQKDELQGKGSTRATTMLSGDELRSLYRHVQETGILEQEETGTGFLPDSIIGSISFEAPDAKITYYFLAEEHQQKSQRKELSAPIQKLMPLLKKLCEVVQERSGKQKAD